MTLRTEQIALLKQKSCQVQEKQLQTSEFMEFAAHLDHHIVDRLARYPNVAKLYNHKSLEAAVDFSVVDAERDRLLNDLSLVLEKEQMSTLVAKVGAYKQKQISQGSFLSYLKKLADDDNQLDLSDYPNFVAFHKYIINVESVDRVAFPAEFEKFREELIRDLDSGSSVKPDG